MTLTPCLLSLIRGCGGFRGLLPVLRWWEPAMNEVVWTCDGAAARGEAVLTIDDAPGSADEMNALLDELKARGVRATFFIISSFVTTERAALVRRMVAEGHELGNHMVRDAPTTTMPPEQFERELLQCEAVLDAYRSPPPVGAKWYRPPSGRVAAWQLSILQRHGYRIALGDVYPLDVSCAAGEGPSLVHHVLASLLPGSVVILHAPDTAYQGRGWLGSTIVQVVQRAPLRFVTLTEGCREGGGGGGGAGAAAAGVASGAVAAVLTGPGAATGPTAAAGVGSCVSAAGGATSGAGGVVAAVAAGALS